MIRKTSHLLENPAATWRLIMTNPLSGAENMAIDEALLRSFDPDCSMPVLRLYGWNPPSLSLGRFQKASEVLDLEHCRISGIAVVRRATGGGVIYHADELTYSMVCAPEQIPAASSVKDSFRVLTGFLLAFYRRLGLDAGYAVDTLPVGTVLGERTAFCFSGRETFDILVNNRKIGGNAQRRLKRVIFQHGSIPLLNYAGVGLSYMRQQAPELVDGVTSLAECGVSADRNYLLKEIRAAFSGHFNVKFHDDKLSEQEQVDMEQLLADKYSADSWNLEGIWE